MPGPKTLDPTERFGESSLGAGDESLVDTIYRRVVYRVGSLDSTSIRTTIKLPMTYRSPYGSKNPNNRVLGPKYTLMVFALKPYYWGLWTLRVDLGVP